MFPEKMITDSPPRQIPPTITIASNVIPRRMIPTEGITRKLPGYQMPEDGHVETDLKNASNLLVSPETSDMPSGGNLPQGVKNSAAVIAGTSNNSSDRSVIKLPSGNGTFSGNGSFGRDDSDDNSGSGASGRYPGGNASGGGAGGGGGNTNSSGTTPVPTPTPVPAPTPAPAPVPTPTPVVDPDYPNKGDKPSPPDLPPDINYPSFSIRRHHYRQYRAYFSYLHSVLRF